MASYTLVTRSIHKTLTANSVDTVTLQPGFSEVEVLNRDTSGTIYFRSTNTPTVGGDDTYVVMPSSALKIPRQHFDSDPDATLQLISSTACAYSVTVV